MPLFALQRGSSSALDADLHLAQQLQQQEMKAAAASGRRSSRGSDRRGAYTESGGGEDDYDYEYEDVSDEGGGGGSRGRSRSRSAAAAAAAAQGGGGGGGSGLKLKIKLPNPMSGRPPLPPAATPSAARGATPSYNYNSYQQQQEGGTGTATGASSEADYGTTADGDEDGEVQYIEWDDDDAEAREEALKKKKRMPHCLLSFEELEVMDDEVERVLGHRDVEGAVVNPRDPWASREFYVKWARYSYIHCSWDAYTTLKQLGGFKRILNYCRRQDQLAAERGALTAEEREDRDVRAEMEAEIEREHSQVERIAAERLVTITTHPAVPSPRADGVAAELPPAEEQHPTTTTVVQFLCKWQGLPYSEATWESAEDVARIGANDLVEAFRKREATSLEPRRGVDAARRAFSASGHRAFEKQPDFLKGEGTLRDYQLEGLNWMAYSWARGVNGILADEMGLGKTVQCASMIGYLSQIQSIGGPFLIIVPLSTVPNWAREFRKWIPQINAVVYVGDAPSREVIRSFEFPLPGPATGRQFKFDALITTYELALKDASILRNVKWSYLMVDEAHRLKNNESALYRELSQWNFKSKLLVTGTPLQNNMRELWCLLHFLHPEKFPSAEEFEANYDTKEQAGVQRLHQALGPHLLRRVIKDVEKSLPPKNERILRVPMTPLQKQYYRWILTRNFKELNKSSKGSQVTLLNIIMDLKKCCNHPFLFESARENYNTIPIEGGSDVDRLVVTSGKMVLLDKLLRRLKETGHRVLIFSQMVRVLDILSEYMTLRGFRHQRLDGSTPAHQRHQAMERFNAPGSEDFAFLLSTRAGGLGINLATADTVLLFDSDWNPQNDLQAMSRAHRIGQKDIVNIYRLVASGSVEEDILERAKRKMVLDHVVIQRMDTSGRTVLDPGAGGGPGGAAAARLFGKDELAAILKFGAGELFKDDDGSIPDGAPGSSGSTAAVAAAANPAGLMTDEDLDAILARAEVVETNEDAAPGGADDLLAQFNVATFKSEDNDAAFWDRLIPEHLRADEKPVQNDEPGIRAARLRAMEGPGNLAPDLAFRPKVKKPKAEPGPPIEGAMLRIDRWPQAVDDEGRLIAGEADPRPNGFPRTLSRRDATAFVRAVKRHGLASKLDVIANEGGVAALKQGNSKTLNALWHGLLRGCEKAVDLHAKRVRTLQAPGGGAGGASDLLGGAGTETGGGVMEATPATSMDTLQGGGGSGQFQDASTVAGAPSAATAAAAGAGAGVGMGGSKLPADARLDFFGSDVRAADILAFTRQMALLETKVGSFAAQPDAARRLRLTMAERPAPTAWMRACGWTPEDDSALLVGLYRHGLGAWDKYVIKK
jgi:chromodomain-helicase-DNA-binding protein 1